MILNRPFSGFSCVGWLTLGVALVTPVAIHAEPLQDLAKLESAIGTFAAPGMPRLDKRLRLAACPAPIVQWYGTGHASVEARCEGTPTWRIFVPITTPKPAPEAAPKSAASAAKPAPTQVVPVKTATISAPSAAITAGSVVVARPVLKGALLTAEDLRIDPSISSFGAIARIDQVVGHAAARPLNPGELMRVAYLAEPPLVRRGDPVTIKIGEAGLEISTDGIAEEDAPAGGRVRVRNRATGGRMQAIVYQAGIVVLPGYKNAETGRE